MRKTLAILVLLSIVTVGGCDRSPRSSVSAAPVVKSVGVVSSPGIAPSPRSEPARLAPQRRCGFHFDVSTSVPADARSRVITTVDRSIALFSADVSCSALSLGTFTDRGLFTDVRQYALPAEVHEPCRAATPHSPADRINQAFEGYRQLTDRRCEDQRKKEQRQYVQAVSSLLTRFRNDLRSIVTAKSACTDLVGYLALLSRISQPNDVDIVVTDAEQTCPALADLPAIRGRLLFVLLPSEGDPREEAFQATERATNVTSLMQGSRFMVPAELQAEAWWKGVVQ